MLAVVGGKGGCGKTTTTLGVAGALARQRKPVLAVDADPEMPDLHVMAGVAREPGLAAVASGWPVRMVAGRASAADVPPGVAVLPAGDGAGDGGRCRDGTRTLAHGDGRKTPVHGDGTGTLTRLSGRTETVLLDCPAGAGPDAVAPLRAADAAVVVTTPEPACLRDAAKTTAMARELGVPVAGAVVCRADESPDGIAALLDCDVLGTVPEVAAGRSPLGSERVRAAHDRLVSALQPKYL